MAFLLTGILQSNNGSLTLAYQTSLVSSTSTTTPSFSGANLGTASADRYIVAVFASLRSVSGAMAVGTAVIAGVAANIVVQGNASAHGETCAIAIANVTSGTTGTISWVTNQTANRHEVSTYSVTGGLQSTTPTTTAIFTSGLSTPSVSINVNAGGVALGEIQTNIGSTTNTWTGLTKNTDGLADVGWSTASGAFATQQTGLTVTAQPSSGNQGALVVASFR